jgi:nucleotide-binding universal stress UspA family protein
MLPPSGKPPENEPLHLSDDSTGAVQAFVTATLGEQQEVEIEIVAVQGQQASAALVDAAADADVLVVGSHGAGGISGLLLGSVGRQSAQHAPCPVVIVRRVATQNQAET